MIRFLRTIFDMGLIRFVLRINYELRKIIDSKLPKRFILGKIKPQDIFNSWQNKEEFYFKTKTNLPQKADFFEFIEFKFLNKKEKLKVPFNWNNKNWDRLWQFNLHYFEWAREILEKSLINNLEIEDLKVLEPLIDQWIKYNPVGCGDGWHSYTLSLRIRNWIWLFRCFKSLKNQLRINSLWEQILWLHAHKESCHGGNHFLENLITLIIGSLQFKSKRATQIYNESKNLLKKELDIQILEDGGHQERSTSYHISILERLIELGLMIEIFRGERPYWLIHSIFKMKNWLEIIIIQEKAFPIFNDSSSEACSDIRTIIKYSESFLTRNQYIEEGFRQLLLSKAFNKTKIDNSNPTKIKKHARKKTIPKVSILKETGWFIFNHLNGYDLVFKCGTICPKYLPAHGHSDQFTFDFWKDGEPILRETGVSTYKKGFRRHYERSIVSHNSIQLGEKNNHFIKWIEPLEIWSSFRAGRKSKRLDFDSGKHQDWLWLKASHDGYKKLVFFINRFILLNIDNEGFPILIITDIFKSRSKNKNLWRSYFHMMNDIDQIKTNKKLNWNFYSNERLNIKKVNGYYAKGFNLKKKREFIKVSGESKNKYSIITYILARKDIKLNADFLDNEKIYLDIDSKYSITIKPDSKPVFDNF